MFTAIIKGRAIAFRLPAIAAASAFSIRNELLSQAQMLPGWTEPEADEVLFNTLKHYYLGLGDLLLPRLDPWELEGSDRHRIFISSGAAIDGAGMIAGLSKIDQELGLKISDAKADTGEVHLTSGDPFLDITTQTIMIFGCLEAAAVLNIDELGRSLVYAGELRDPKALAKKQQKADMERHNPESDALFDSILAESNKHFPEALPQGRPKL